MSHLKLDLPVNEYFTTSVFKPMVELPNDIDRKVSKLIEYGLNFVRPRINGEITPQKFRRRGLKLNVTDLGEGKIEYAFYQRENLLAPPLVMMKEDDVKITFNYDPQTLIDDLEKKPKDIVDLRMMGLI